MARQISLQTKSSLIPATAFTQLPYWKRLTEEDKKAVERESQELARAMFHEGASKLEQGRHLVELRKRLEPYRVFVRHLRAFKMSFKTAYRYMSAYENAKRRFPEPVLQAVLARGLDIVGESAERPYGKYTPIVKSLPPPRTSDKYAIQEWVDTLENKYKKMRGEMRAGLLLGYDHAHPATDSLVKAAFRHVRIQFRRIPVDQKKKAMKELFGYLMAEFGVSSPIEVRPSEAPDEYRRGPGKPRLEAAAQ